MFDRYININEYKISGRQASGLWQCSEFTVSGRTPKEVLKEYDYMISEINRINNKYNVEEKEKKKDEKVRMG